MENKEKKTSGALTPAIEKLKSSSCGCKAIFELDRRGSNDCVFYDCDNPDFVKYVEGFGFKEAPGSFSDISIIAPEWHVAAANLSVGYYNEHQEIETLHTDELEVTIEKVKKILDNAENMLSYTYIERQKVGFSWGMHLGTHCYICHKPFNDDKVELNDKYFSQTAFVCKKCYSDFFYDV